MTFLICAASWHEAESKFAYVRRPDGDATAISEACLSATCSMTRSIVLTGLSIQHLSAPLRGFQRHFLYFFPPGKVEAVVSRVTVIQPSMGYL